MIPMPVTVAANGLTMLENPEASQGLTLVAERPADGALLAHVHLQRVDLEGRRQRAGVGAEFYWKWEEEGGGFSR